MRSPRGGFRLYAAGVALDGRPPVPIVAAASTPARNRRAADTGLKTARLFLGSLEVRGFTDANRPLGLAIDPRDHATLGPDPRRAPGAVHLVPDDAAAGSAAIERGRGRGARLTAGPTGFLVAKGGCLRR
jgi:hypothetical protein